MEFSDDDDGFDDDEDFIALTLKPPKPVQTTQPSTQSPNELLVAKGEVAILRAKLEELERIKQVEREELLKNNLLDKENNENKIKALEGAVQRLEDERKFLSVEVRNLSNNATRKKRKTSDGLGDVDMDSATPLPIPISAPVITVQQPQPPKIKPTTVKLINPGVINENSLFIDHILSHTIIGASSTTMGTLSHIASPIKFRDDYLNVDDPFILLPKTSIASQLLDHLMKKRDALRLDELISRFIHGICGFIDTIQSGEYKLSIPFLLSIIHSSITFRPSAVTSDTLKELSKFCINLIHNHLDLIKKDEGELDSHQYQQQLQQEKVGVPSVHRKFIDVMILVFSVELLEIVLMNVAVKEELEDSGIIKKFIQDMGDFNTILRLGMGNGSSLVIMFSLIESLNTVGRYENFPPELILVFCKILCNGVEPRKDGIMWFNGLNRILGDDESCHMMYSLFDHIGIGMSPLVIYEQKSENKKYEHHLINLQLRICDFFEKILIENQDDVALFNSDPVILKQLISTIAKQQEYIFRSPRTPTTHLRSKLIASLINNIHLIWELTYSAYSTFPRITKDTTHELIITLARIAFSTNNSTSLEASEFLLKVRSKDRTAPVFNKWSEARAREVSHVSDVCSKGTVRDLVQAEIGFSNGVEFAYDDYVVELARDILEKCTTMDEADELYCSMNAV